MEALDVTATPQGSLVDRALRLISDVRAGEGGTALILTVNLFLLMVGYYVVKTVREPLVLVSGGAEMKSYAAAAQALTLMGFVPLYSWFSSRVDRMRLVTGVILFFVVCIEAFYVGALGSKRTQEKRRTRLTEAGLAPDALARLHGPIGLPLGGRSPEEIAIAILAEIVATRNRAA